MNNSWDDISESITNEKLPYEGNEYLQQNKKQLTVIMNALKNVEKSTTDEQLSKDQIQQLFKQDSNHNVISNNQIQKSQDPDLKQKINHQQEIKELNSQKQYLLQTQNQQLVNECNYVKYEPLKLKQIQGQIKKNNLFDKQNDNLQFNQTSLLSIDQKVNNIDEVILKQIQENFQFKQWRDNDEVVSFKQSFQKDQNQCISQLQTINNKPILVQYGNSESFCTQQKNITQNYNDAQLSMYSAGFKKSKKKKKIAFQNFQTNTFNINDSQSRQINELSKDQMILNDYIKQNLSMMLLETSMIQVTPNTYTQNGIDATPQNFHSNFHSNSELDLSLIINQPIVFYQSWKVDRKELKNILNTFFQLNQQKSQSYISLSSDSQSRDFIDLLNSIRNQDSLQSLSLSEVSYVSGLSISELNNSSILETSFTSIVSSQILDPNNLYHSLSLSSLDRSLIKQFQPLQIHQTKGLQSLSLSSLDSFPSKIVQPLQIRWPKGFLFHQIQYLNQQKKYQHRQEEYQNKLKQYLHRQKRNQKLKMRSGHRKKKYRYQWQKNQNQWNEHLSRFLQDDCGQIQQQYKKLEQQDKRLQKQEKQLGQQEKQLDQQDFQVSRLKFQLQIRRKLLQQEGKYLNQQNQQLKQQGWQVQRLEQLLQQQVNLLFQKHWYLNQQDLQRLKQLLQQQGKLLQLQNWQLNQQNLQRLEQLLQQQVNLIYQQHWCLNRQHWCLNEQHCKQMKSLPQPQLSLIEQDTLFLQQDKH